MAMDRLSPPEQVILSHSVPTQNKELSRYPRASPIDEDWPEDDNWEDAENNLLLNGPHDSGHYGSSVPVGSGGIYGMGRPGKKERRRSGIREGGNVGASITSLANRFFNKREDSSDEDELPPTIEMKYRRSKLDWVKLVILPIVYILLMAAAFVFAFYTIQGLIDSYNNKVRSIQQIDVNGRYPPIGIAIFPRFSIYEDCQYRYYDNLSPVSHTSPGSCGNFQIPVSCFMRNMSFNSSVVQNLTRSVMIFQGPRLVKCKESLKLAFGIDTTKREYSALEYILFDDWEAFDQKNPIEQQEYLAFIEQNRTVYTFPAGFRTWVKLSYSIYENFGSKRNHTEFDIIDNYASFNDYNDTYMPMEVLFEWKTNHYDYVQEIISTTIWSAFGSFCGLLLTIVKIAEFCKAWIRRFRRDKQKKRIHLQKLEEEQKRLMESYEHKKKKKQEAKLKQSLEATNTIAINVQQQQ